MMRKLSISVFLLSACVVLSVSGLEDELIQKVDTVLQNVQAMNTKVDQIAKNIERGRCQSGWDSFCGTTGCFCYHSGPKNLDMTAAHRYCKRLKSRVVSIQSQDEQEFLKKYFRNMDRAWIGLYLKNPTRWLDRSRVSYTNWNRGEPNRTGKCVAMKKYRNYTWDDIPCGSKSYNLGLICKKKEN